MRELPSESTNTLGPTIQRYRIRTGLSQNQLARQSGVDPAYINRLERGLQRTAGRNVILRIAEILKLSYLDTERFLCLAGHAPQEDWITRAQKAEHVLETLTHMMEEYRAEEALSRD